MEKMIFSEYLKFLDEKHSVLQSKMKAIVDELEFLKSIPKSKDNLLRQKFMAIQGNDKDALTKIEEQLGSLPSEEERKQKINQL
ncbi:MAG: hypothetical protein QW222_04325, partial [Candidatus Bathyarchaeia archaeon]